MERRPGLRILIPPLAAKEAPYEAPHEAPHEAPREAPQEAGEEAPSRRVRLVLEYDGTDFAGWQRQHNAPTIQGVLEDALAQITGERTHVGGAGRTDAGVHALGQVASFITRSRIDTAQLRRALCAVLPPGISVVASDDVPLDFDARRHARGKLYRYRIWNAESRSPLEARFSWHRGRRLDDVAMAEAARCLVGEHDFSAFRASDCERKTTVRVIRRLEVIRSGALLCVEIEATAFLKNMVRVIVGTLVDVGRGRRHATEMATILASGDRGRAGPTAPPTGLFLVRVHYDPPLPPRA